MAAVPPRKSKPIEELRKWQKQLADARGTWEPFWRDVRDYIAPHRGRFLDSFSATDVNHGGRRDGKILNGDATKHAETMGSGMQSGLTSKARPWFELRPPVFEIAMLPRVARYYRQVKRVLLESFDRSNLYNALYDLYCELGCFGTGAMAILPHPDKVFRFRTFTIGEYYLSSNHRGEVDAFFYRDFMTVRQMVESYGYDRVGDYVRGRYDASDYEALVGVEVAILRYPELIGIKVPNGMPIAEAHYLVSDNGGRPGGGDQGRFLAVRGYRSFPVVTPRWSTVGRDVYGWGPTRNALPDVKQIQMMERDKLQILKKIGNPPLQGPPEMARLGVDAGPGGFNPVSGSGDGVRPLYMVNPDLNAIEAAIAGKVAKVGKDFFTDLFLLFQQKDLVNRAQMTATEVGERAWERYEVLGPVLERLHYEVLDPLIARATEMLYFAGKIPPAPPELAELDGPAFRVEYVSALSQAQKAGAAKKNEAMVAYVGQLAGVWPNAPELLDEHKAFVDYAESIGGNPEIMRDAEAYERIKQQRAKQIEAQQQAEMAGQMADGAKVASDIDSGNLSQIAGMITGSGQGVVV